jgi:uncharacterized protein with ParB-like and HNH nuclease domain
MQIGISEPKLKSVEEFFAGGTRFSVPIYQRNFSWTSEETLELWEDVIGAVSRNGEFFVGTIVLHNKPEAQEIIDGQQRLACITMLFSAVRNVFLANHDDSRAAKIQRDFLGSTGYERDAILTPKLALNRINNTTFQQYVLTSANAAKVADLLKDKTMRRSNRLLLEAYAFFLNQVTSEAANKGTQADEFLVPVIDTLRTKLKLITIPVMTDEDANLFFESLNARGKELAISDLVKNRLYFVARDKVDNAQQYWEQMETDLGKLPVPEFLRHYWIAKKADKDSPMVREKHVYRMVSKAANNQKAAIDLVMDLRKSAKDYARLFDYSLWPDDPAYDDGFKQSLEDLRLFGVTQTSPLLLNAIQVFPKTKEIARTFRAVANFSFRYFIVGNQSPGSLERLSKDIAFNIRAKTFISASDVADALRAANPDAAFRADFTLATFGEKRAKIARYTLARITNYLKKLAGGAEEIVDPNDKLVSLEHVLPQSIPTAWRAAFKKGVDPKDYVYRAGNLTLLNAKVNHDAADKSFAAKKTVALDGSGLKINEVFKTLSTWSEREIGQRQDSLAKTATEVWKL